jgi:hypothetical protein
MKPRVLVVIPAYNEEQTIADVLLGLRQAVPEYDRVVVNDGSRDGTGRMVAGMGEQQITLPCNVGYGHALQTGMKYALERGYDVVVSFDGDGQHVPQDVPRVVEALLSSDADLVIGSRYCDNHTYSQAFSRKIGQLLFSHLSQALIGKRIYDTTSGFKALRAPVCDVLVQGTFMDFHTETLVRLSMLGFKIAEHPISIKERVFGKSMHSTSSILEYPLKTLLLTFVAVVDVFLARRAR